MSSKTSAVSLQERQARVREPDSEHRGWDLTSLHLRTPLNLLNHLPKGHVRTRRLQLEFLKLTQAGRRIFAVVYMLLYIRVSKGCNALQPGCQ